MASIEVKRDEADQEQFDATRLTGLDPNKKYRWGRKDPINLTRLSTRGYVVTDNTDGKITHIVSDATKMKKGQDTSTAIEWGDMILVECSREMYEERLGRKRARIVRQTKGVTQAYKDAVARMSRAADQENLAFEEHRDKGGYSDSKTERQVREELEALPEIED